MYSTKIRLGNKILLLVIFLSIQFIILSSLAILFFPENYSFFKEPLSSLGFTHVNGKENFISSILFNFGMFFLGIGSILLFILLSQFFRATLLEQWSGISGASLGSLSGLAMCGAAITPGDINFDLHVMFAPITFLLGIITFSLFGIAIISNQNFDNRYGFVAFGYVCITSLSIVVMMIGPAYTTTTGLILQTTFQKIIIYTECVILIALSYGSLGYIKRKGNNKPEIP